MKYTKLYNMLKLVQKLVDDPKEDEEYEIALEFDKLMSMVKGML